MFPKKGPFHKERIVFQALSLRRHLFICRYLNSTVNSTHCFLPPDTEHGDTALNNPLHGNSDTFHHWSLYTRGCNYPLFLRWEEFEYKNSPHSIWTNQPPWGFLGSVFFLVFCAFRLKTKKKAGKKAALGENVPSYEKKKEATKKRNGPKTPARFMCFFFVEWVVVVPLRRMMDWGSSWGSLELTDEKNEETDAPPTRWLNVAWKRGGPQT